jgi:hypothetical protein
VTPNMGTIMPDLGMEVKGPALAMQPRVVLRLAVLNGFHQYPRGRPVDLPGQLGEEVRHRQSKPKNLGRSKAPRTADPKADRMACRLEDGYTRRAAGRAGPRAATLRSYAASY